MNCDWDGEIVSRWVSWLMKHDNQNKQFQTVSFSQVVMKLQLSLWLIGSVCCTFTTYKEVDKKPPLPSYLSGSPDELTSAASFKWDLSEIEYEVKDGAEVKTEGPTCLDLPATVECSMSNNDKCIPNPQEAINYTPQLSPSLVYQFRIPSGQPVERTVQLFSKTAGWYPSMIISRKDPNTHKWTPLVPQNNPPNSRYQFEENQQYVLEVGDSASTSVEQLTSVGPELIALGIEGKFLVLFAASNCDILKPFSGQTFVGIDKKEPKMTYQCQLERGGKAVGIDGDYREDWGTYDNSLAPYYDPNGPTIRYFFSDGQPSPHKEDFGRKNRFALQLLHTSNGKQKFTGICKKCPNEGGLRILSCENNALPDCFRRLADAEKRCRGMRGNNNGASSQKKSEKDDDEKTKSSNNTSVKFTDPNEQSDGKNDSSGKDKGDNESKNSNGTTNTDSGSNQKGNSNDTSDDMTMKNKTNMNNSNGNNNSSSASGNDKIRNPNSNYQSKSTASSYQDKGLRNGSKNSASTFKGQGGNSHSNSMRYSGSKSNNTNGNQNRSYNQSNGAHNGKGTRMNYGGNNGSRSNNGRGGNNGKGTRMNYGGNNGRGGNHGNGPYKGNNGNHGNGPNHGNNGIHNYGPYNGNNGNNGHRPYNGNGANRGHGHYNGNGFNNGNGANYGYGFNNGNSGNHGYGINISGGNNGNYGSQDNNEIHDGSRTQTNNSNSYNSNSYSSNSYNSNSYNNNSYNGIPHVNSNGSGAYGNGNNFQSNNNSDYHKVNSNIVTNRNNYSTDQQRNNNQTLFTNQTNSTKNYASVKRDFFGNFKNWSSNSIATKPKMNYKCKRRPSTNNQNFNPAGNNMNPFGNSNGNGGGNPNSHGNGGGNQNPHENNSGNQNPINKKPGDDKVFYPKDNSNEEIDENGPEVFYPNENNAAEAGSNVFYPNDKNSDQTHADVEIQSKESNYNKEADEISNGMNSIAADISKINLSTPIRTTNEQHHDLAIGEEDKNGFNSTHSSRTNSNEHETDIGFDDENI